MPSTRCHLAASPIWPQMLGGLRLGDCSLEVPVLTCVLLCIKILCWIVCEIVCLIVMVCVLDYMLDRMLIVCWIVFFVEPPLESVSIVCMENIGLVMVLDSFLILVRGIAVGRLYG